MHVRKTPFSAHLRRYNHLAKRLRRLMKSGEITLLSVFEKRKLHLKFKQRLGRVRPLIPAAKLRAAAACAATLLLGPSLADAQNFAPPLVNPFGINLGMYNGFQNFADIDGDGDLDLIFQSYEYDNGTYTMNVILNQGTPQAPNFTSSNVLQNPFGLESGYTTQPVLIDLDNDSDLDIISGGLGDGAFYYQENTGTATQPAFGNLEVNPFNLSNTTEYNLLTAADIDNDGDIDLLGGGQYAQLFFFENIGSPTTPLFDDPVINPFNINPNGEIVIPTLADIDGDGDNDLFYMTYGNEIATIVYVENTGTVSSPFFENPIASPFGITTKNIQVPILSAADIDSDGDQDIFINNIYYSYDSQFFFYENLSESTAVDDVQVSGNDILLSPNPAHDLLQVKLKDGFSADEIQLSILNATGQLVKSQVLATHAISGGVQVEIADLNPGIYFLKIGAGGQPMMIKFVKE